MKYMYELIDPQGRPGFIYYGSKSPDELWQAYKQGLIRNRFLDTCERKPQVGFVKFAGLNEEEARAIRDAYSHIAARGIPQLKEHLRGRPATDGRRAVIATDVKTGRETLFESVSATEHHGYAPRDVFYVLAHTRKTHGGKLWKYASDSPQSRGVEKIGADGEVTHYPSVSAAARQNGCKRGDIRRWIDTVSTDQATGSHWRWGTPTP
ncbi:MAG: hypothetical protein HQ567_15505 [Candidatus Nealsonbacteria bacterium]|nr:hypothetical protein [Candidatus Nealsonbacteria bacterium]